MGTINCSVNANGTLTVTSVSGPVPANTFARFTGVGFDISGGGTFQLAFTSPQSGFLFSTSNPIDFGECGQPSWITVEPGTTAQALTLNADSSATGFSEFTIPSAAMEGQSLTVTLQSHGGSGEAGGTIYVYVGDDQTALIGQMPAEATATGKDMEFGFRDQGPNTLILSPVGTTAIEGLTWNPSQPGFVAVSPISAGNLTVTITVNGTTTLTSSFAIQTNFGTFDPTIVMNPDENAP